MVELIYRLDKITNKEHEGGIKVSETVMDQVQKYLRDYVEKAGQIKTHLRGATAILDQISFEMIGKLLLGSRCESKKGETPEIIRTHKCEHCEQVCASGGALGNHKRLKHGIVASKSGTTTVAV
jgi:hypothetical protein